jgi:ribose transport system permease protein
MSNTKPKTANALLAAIRTREGGNVICLIAIALIIMVFEGNRVAEPFLSPANQQALWRNISLLAVFAIGETFVIISGGIDLSVGSLIALSAVMLGFMLAAPGESVMYGMSLPLAVAVPIILIAMAGIGALHGYLVGWVGIQPFVATLGSMIFFRSLAMVLSNQMKITITNPVADYIGNGKPLGIPVPLIVMVVVALAAAFVMRSTIHGRYLRAIGSNEEAAALSGVRVRRVKMLAYITCSVLAGVAGIVHAGYLRCGDPGSGQMYELYAIAASVIGGCSLMGGVGSVVGTITGAAMFYFLRNGLYRLVKVKSPSLWEGIIVGSVLVGAETFNIIRQRRAARAK